MAKEKVGKARAESLSKLWRFFREDRLEHVLMIAVPAVISWLLIGSVTEVTAVTMVGLLVVLLAFTAFRYRRQESGRFREMAQNLTAIVDRFKPIMEGTSDIAIKNIALDFLKDEGVAESLGKGVAGWRAFFDQYSGQASAAYNHVSFGLTSFVREPRSREELQGLIRDFKGALSDHYISLEYFHRMIKDVGIANIPLTIENRYKQFRQEYNSLVQKIRDIANVLDRETPPALNGTVMLMFIEELENRYGFVFPSRLG